MSISAKQYQNGNVLGGNRNTGIQTWQNSRVGQKVHLFFFSSDGSSSASLSLTSFETILFDFIVTTVHLKKHQNW